MSACAHTDALLDGLLSQDDAARALARLGFEVPVEVTGEDVDFRRLLFAMDVLFANGYSTSALAGFLETPHPRLDWRTPAEIAVEAGGIDRVRDLIAEVVAARRGRSLPPG
jgi:uncharacterized protein (DUF2384 family)